MSATGNRRRTRPQAVVADVAEILRRRSRTQSASEAFTFKEEIGGRAVTLTYGQLDTRALAIATELRRRKAAGRRALLLFSPGPEYVAAFYACLYAGVVAVPAYPLDPSRWDRAVRRLQALVSDADPSVVITSDAYEAVVESFVRHVPELSSCERVVTSTLPDHLSQQWEEVPRCDTDIAFLQYTSGSTARPRGVALSHANVVHNVQLIARAFALREGLRAVIWLPPYHDMGLIGGILAPISVGMPVTLMDPLHFMRSPLDWLVEISRSKATVSGGPNFAYDLCIAKIDLDRAPDLDLSSWTTAFCGAEPVRAATLRGFAEKFAATGFSPAAFYPCYGLAEATLLVSGGAVAEPPVTRRFDRAQLESGTARSGAPGATDVELVGCGRPVDGQHVQIVDDADQPVGPNQVGEVIVSGPSVARGYWNRQGTSATFAASVRDQSGRCLRTGDLGFIDDDGELFITGRKDDLIVVRGRNLYPQDLEGTVEAAGNGVRPGCVAAFPVTIAGETSVVVMAEVDEARSRDWEATARSIHLALVSEHDVVPHAVVLVARQQIPKTSSGKIQRRSARDAYEGHTVRVVASTEPAEASAQGGRGMLGDGRDAAGLRHQAAAAERLPQVIGRAMAASLTHLDMDRTLPELGGDSLIALAVHDAVASELGVDVPMRLLLMKPLRQIAAYVAQPADSGSSGSRAPGGVEPAATGTVLSAGQRALWYLSQLEPESPVRTIVRALSVTGPLDFPALEAALLNLVERHQALRTAIVTTADGTPAPRLVEPAGMEIPVHDVAGASEDELELALIREAARPVNPADAPLVRVRAFRRSSQHHVLLVAVHHVAADLASLAVLLRELQAAYAARIAGGTVVLPPAPQFSATAARLQAADDEPSWRYWSQQLRAPLPELELPRRTGQHTGIQQAPQRHVTAADAATVLTATARRQCVTPFAVVMAAYATLLHRLTGAEDLVIGTPVSMRRPGDERAVGYLVNTVALRLEISGTMSFEDLIRQAHERMTDALQHGTMPFAEVVARLNPQRNGVWTPIFSTMLAYHSAKGGLPPDLAAMAAEDESVPFALGEAIARARPLRRHSPQAPLQLGVVMRDTGLSIAVEAGPEIEPELVTRLAGRLEVLLEAGCRSPSAALAALPVMTAGEERELASFSAGAPGAGEDDLCLHQLVARQAERTPEAVAVRSETETLTYGELRDEVEELSARLRGCGVGREVPVTVLLPRTPALVCALLAVLDAGGAYLPLDPDYPRDRIVTIMGRSGAPVVVTTRELVAHLPETGAQVIVVGGARDGPGDAMVTQAGSRPARPCDAAYILYTSGSTGEPKGVVVEHRNATSLVRWALGAYARDELGGVLAATSVCFDLSVFEIFVTLAAGGTVVMVRDPLGLPNSELADHVTLVNTVPSVALEFEAAAALPPGVVSVNLAGEPLPADLASRLAASGVRVRNLYAPTETTTYSTMAVVDAGTGAAAVPIGRPISGTAVYVLDGDMSLLPVGVAGELFIGGAGVARGYWRQPGLTAERFLPDPFGPPGGRLYRTGDRARWRPDGNLEFLGRIDHQVKVRGYRIEPGEVESALMDCTGVRQAVVVARGDYARRQLVAYVVGRENATTSAQALRDSLRARLPGYMVPSAFVFLDRMPLTPNRKVDRGQLPPPGQDDVATTSFTAPRTATERRMAEIWCELLGLERVGIYDDFFALGGHSLLGIGLVARLRDAFGVDLPLRQLFELHDIAGIARAIEQAPRASQRLPLVPLDRSDYALADDQVVRPPDLGATTPAGRRSRNRE
jgi:amino acid adenylation domain-containing protein